MPTILGISAFYHDSAAALVVDGDIVAAAQEERFTRRKHDPAFPSHAVQYCLRERGLSVADLDYVAFYEKPMRKFERLLETYLSYAPSGFKSFSMAIPVWLKEKVNLPAVIRRELGDGFRGSLVFTDHHREPCGQRLLPQPLRRGRHPHPRRGRRVEHYHDGHRARPPHRAHPAPAVPAFARPALFGLHLLLRFQGQQRRVQAHGPGALRQAGLPRPHPDAPDRPARRRQLLARHAGTSTTARA